MMKKMNVIRKRSIKSILATVLCVVMCLSVMPTGAVSCATGVMNGLTSVGTSGSEETINTDPNGTLGKNSDVGIEVTESITGAAGKKVTVAFKLLSSNVNTIKLKSVYPVIDNAFPFETSGDAYKIVSAGVDPALQQVLAASFEMKTRSDIETGYHSVRFIGEYSKMEADGTFKDYYVIKTINIYFTGADYVEEKEDDNSSDNKSNKDEEEEEDSGNDNSDEEYDGGYDGGSYDGSSDGGGDAVAPKLIITGYETVPEKIMAGETFKITIHVQNTSKNVSVCNGKFLIGNEAGSFIPTSGSSAVFVESIPAGKTGDIEIEMKAGAELQQKNYSLVIKGDFDDGKGNNFTSSDSLTIPVYQEVKFAITEVSMSPEILGIDSEGALMFTINNQSNAGVYNVKVSPKSDAVEGEESYVGNIAGSSSAYATLNLRGVKDNSDTGNITVVITYEDSEGTENTVEQSVACVVSENGGMDVMEEEMYGDEYYEEEYYEEDSYIAPWVIVLIVIAVLGIIGVTVFLVLRRKKRMAELLEAEDGEDDIDDENF